MHRANVSLNPEQTKEAQEEILRVLERYELGGIDKLLALMSAAYKVQDDG